VVPPKPVALPADEDELMFFAFKPGTGDIYCFSGNTKRHITPDEWGFRHGPFGGNPYAASASGPTGGPFQALVISQPWFDSYIEVH
jgi:hypothetical protein